MNSLRSFVAVSLVATASLLTGLHTTYAAQNDVTVTIGNFSIGGQSVPVPLSINWNSLEFAATPQQYQPGIINMFDPQGNSIGNVLGSCTSNPFNAQTKTLSWTCTQGSYSLQYNTSGGDIDVTMTLVNNSGSAIGGAGVDLFTGTMPGFLSHAIVSGEGWTPIDQYYFSGGGQLYTNGVYIRTGDPSTSALFSTTMGGAAQGQTGVSHAFFHFRPAGTALVDAVGNDIRAWALNYPFVADQYWPDRRPIGTMFLAGTPCRIGGACPNPNTIQDWSTNVNGWFWPGDKENRAECPTASSSDNVCIGPYVQTPQQLAAQIDVTTDAGRQAWAARMLSTVDTSILNLKRANAQGIIVWDLEGEKWPQCTSYVGDPRVADDDKFAPEWKTTVSYGGNTIPVIDAVFKKFKDAGFKTGVTLRPDQVDFNPVHEDGCGGGDDYGAVYGIRPNHVYAPDRTARVALLKSKIDYAYTRWGVTMYYIDSTSWSNDGEDMVELHAQLVSAYPGVHFMLMPENTEIIEYSVGLPYYCTSCNGTSHAGPGMINIIGTAFPKAAAVLHVKNFNEWTDNYWELVNAIRVGSAPLFNTWYTDAAVDYINEMYAKAALPIVPPTVTASGASSVKGTGATLSGAVTNVGNSFISTRGFQYGLTTSYGSNASTNGTFDSSLSNTDAGFSSNLTGLDCNSEYHYRAFATNFAGSVGDPHSQTGFSADQTFKTAACGGVSGLESRFNSFKNFFNPAKGETCTISYSLASQGSVQLSIYDRRGKLVTTLYSGDHVAGTFSDIGWNGKNSSGSTVVSGVYTLMLKADGVTQTKKIVVVK